MNLKRLRFEQELKHKQKLNKQKKITVLQLVLLKLDDFIRETQMLQPSKRRIDFQDRVFDVPNKQCYLTFKTFGLSFQMKCLFLSTKSLSLDELTFFTKRHTYFLQLENFVSQATSSTGNMLFPVLKNECNENYII